MRRRAMCLGLLGATGCVSPPWGGLKAPIETSFTSSTGGHAEETFSADDGLLLYSQVWRPTDLFGPTQVRGVVVVVHGLRDHSSRYSAFARALIRRGYAVYAADLRGHGRSQGPRAHVERFEQYVDDVSVFAKRVREIDLHVPVFMLGHSMGGTIATLFAERPRPELAGVILSAPAIDLNVSILESCGANLLRDITPYAKELELPMNRWSRDEKVIRENKEDPLVYQAAGTVALATELIAAAEVALDEAPFIHVPLLVLHGSDDTITLARGSKALYAKVRSRAKRIKVYKGYYHDLFHEPGHERIFSDIVRFLDRHTSTISGDPAASDEGEDDNRNDNRDDNRDDNTVLPNPDGTKEPDRN